MSATTRYSSGLFAPMPSPGYPGDNFFGSVPASAAASRGTGPMAGGVTGAVNGVLPGGLAAHHAVAIFIVVLAGFGIYWFARKEG